jgi:hypothetical protein
MSHLRVPHDPRGQPDGNARGRERRPGMLPAPSVEGGSSRASDGISLRGGSLAPAIANDEQNARSGHSVGYPRKWVWTTRKSSATLHACAKQPRGA